MVRKALTLGCVTADSSQSGHFVINLTQPSSTTRYSHRVLALRFFLSCGLSLLPSRGTTALSLDSAMSSLSPSPSSSTVMAPSLYSERDPLLLQAPYRSPSPPRPWYHCKPRPAWLIPFALTMALSVSTVACEPAHRCRRLTKSSFAFVSAASLSQPESKLSFSSPVQPRWSTRYSLHSNHYRPLQILPSYTRYTTLLLSGVLWAESPSTASRTQQSKQPQQRSKQAF